MNSKFVAIVLVLLCVVLGVVLVVQTNKHKTEKNDMDLTIASYSNKVTSLDGKYKEQVVVNSTLESNLAATKAKDASDLAALEASLASTSNNLDKSEADAKAAKAADLALIEEKDKKIAALESQNTELDKESGDLKLSLTNLVAQIAMTQKKLDARDGDVRLLKEELKQLQAKKEELEKQISNLAFLKEQVSKLKEQLAIDRRLDWIRRGLTDVINAKGGERLMHPIVSAPPAVPASLQVELHQHGVDSIVPPPRTNAMSSTNTPSAK